MFRIGLKFDVNNKSICISTQCLSSTNDIKKVALYFKNKEKKNVFSKWIVCQSLTRETDVFNDCANFLSENLKEAFIEITAI